MADDIVNDEENVDEEPQETPEQRLEQRLSELEHTQFILTQELNGVKGIAQRTEAVTNNSMNAIATLRGELEDRYAPKRALSLLEKTVRTTLGDDAWETYEHDGEVAALRAEIKQKSVEATPRASQDQDTEVALQQELDLIYRNTIYPRLQRRWKAKGVTEEYALRFKPTLRGRETSEDPRGLVVWEDEWNDKLDKALRSAETASKVRKPIDTTRGASSTDAEAAYVKALKEGLPLPPAEEIDKLTAKYLAM